MIREEADFILPENAYGEEAAYTEILNDTLCQMMDADESVILFRALSSCPSSPAQPQPP